MRRLALLLLLTGCCCQPAPPPPEPVPVADPPTEAPPPPVANHAPGAAAIKGYRAAEKAEAQAVTAPGATAASISSVHEADRQARVAVRELLRQKGQPSTKAIEKARHALDDLIRALENSPP